MERRAANMRASAYGATDDDDGAPTAWPLARTDMRSELVALAADWTHRADEHSARGEVALAAVARSNGANLLATASSSSSPSSPTPDDDRGEVTAAARNASDNAHVARYAVWPPMHGDMQAEIRAARTAQAADWARRADEYAARGEARAAAVARRNVASLLAPPPPLPENALSRELNAASLAYVARAQRCGAAAERASHETQLGAQLRVDGLAQAYADIESGETRVRAAIVCARQYGDRMGSAREQRDAQRAQLDASMRALIAELDRRHRVVAPADAGAHVPAPFEVTDPAAEQAADLVAAIARSSGCPVRAAPAE
jgi:hypothetical protein